MWVFLLVVVFSGKTSASGELCVVVEDEAVFVDGAELAIAPCLSAIAAGDGREVFHWGEDGQIVNTVGVTIICKIMHGSSMKTVLFVFSRCRTNV